MDGLDKTREKRNHNLKEASYYDLTSSGRNIKPAGDGDGAKNKDGIYSAAVVYAAACNNKSYITFPNTNEYLGQEVDGEGGKKYKTTYDSPTAFEDLQKLFSTRRIKKITSEGCASQDGRLVAKGKANTQLAADRTWAFTELIDKLNNTIYEDKGNSDVFDEWRQNKKEDTHKVVYRDRTDAPKGESSIESKNDRYAKLIIEFETEGSSSAVTQGNENKVTPKQNDDGSVSQPTVSEKTETEKRNENETNVNRKEINDLLKQLQERYKKLLDYRDRFEAVDCENGGRCYIDTRYNNRTKYIGLGIFLFMGANSPMYVETMNYRCGYRKLYYKTIDKQLFLVGYYEYDKNKKSFDGRSIQIIEDNDVLGKSPSEFLERSSRFPIYMVPNDFNFTKCKNESKAQNDDVFRVEDCYDYYGKISDIPADATCGRGGDNNTVIEKYTPANVKDLILMKDDSGKYVNEKIFENYYNTLVGGKFTQEFNDDKPYLQYPQYVYEYTEEVDKVITVAEEAKDIAEKLFEKIGKGEGLAEEQAEAEESKGQEKNDLQAERIDKEKELDAALVQFNEECLKGTISYVTGIKPGENLDNDKRNVLLDRLENIQIDDEKNKKCLGIWTDCKILKQALADITKELDEIRSEDDKDANPAENNGQVVNTDWEQDKTSKYVGYNPVRIGSEEGDTSIYKDPNGNYWVEVEDGRLQRLERKIKTRFATNGKSLPPGVEEGEADSNHFRYDQEYYFFRQLEKHDPIVFERLMKKLQYFDPAFHSMTPEGFNARLTFLNQCTRQGNTITMSDKYGKTANNLAFGRPPFCVLRLGDFYNQMIVINSINFDYSVSDGILWDLNPEGAGVQPLLCRVSMNFNFIGGSDMAGPVRRLTLLKSENPDLLFCSGLAASPLQCLSVLNHP